MKSSYAFCVRANCLYVSGGDAKSSSKISPLLRLSDRIGRRFNGGVDGGMTPISQFVVPGSLVLLSQQVNEGCFGSADPHR